MGILSELSTSTGDKRSNEEILNRCLQTPALLHSIAEGLRTGSPQVKQDCAQILIQAGNRRPELLADFVSDLFDASRGKSKKIARTALDTLALAAHSQPNEIFAEREHLLELSRGGGPMGLAALKVLAALCAHSPNYRGKLAVPIIRVLVAVAGKDLAKWLAAASPAVHGSVEGVKRLMRDLHPRLQQLDDAQRRQVDRALAKLERSTKRKGR